MMVVKGVDCYEIVEDCYVIAVVPLTRRAVRQWPAAGDDIMVIADSDALKLARMMAASDDLLAACRKAFAALHLDKKGAKLERNRVSHIVAMAIARTFDTGAILDTGAGGVSGE